MRLIVCAGSYDWEEFLHVWREDQRAEVYASIDEWFGITDSLELGEDLPEPGSEYWWRILYDLYENTDYKAFSVYWLDPVTLKTERFQ